MAAQVNFPCGHSIGIALRDADKPVVCPFCSPKPEELSPEVVDLLRAAREALHSSYDVQAYPGDGKTVQDGVISRIDAMLKRHGPQDGDSK